MSLKVLFLGQKQVGYECLEHLLKLQAKQDIKIQLVGIVEGVSRNQKMAQGLEFKKLAEKAGVPLYIEFPQEIESVDALISVQFHRLLTVAELKKASRYAINLHMAPLPEYRGANQFTFSILNGEKEFGTTLHAMEASVDAGPIYCESRFPIQATDTVYDLYRRTESESVKLFQSQIAHILSGHIQPTAQADLRPSSPRYFYKKADIEGLKKLDPSWPLEKMDRYVRAFDMPGYEPAYFEYGGRRMYVRYQDK